MPFHFAGEAMRTFTGSFALLLAVFICVQTHAQTTQESRLDRLERRLDELEQKYQHDIQARDEEIARLKSQLAQPTTAPTTAEGRAPQDEIEKTKQDVLKDIETNQEQPLTLRVPANFNPDLAVVGDFKGNVSTNNDNPARNRFDLGTLELELRAAVDPRADAVAVIPFSREVEDPLFFDKASANGDVDSGVEIEEAYLFLHDFGIPNLTAKLGRFHLRFGRQNILHNHDWPTADNNFVNQSFLGPEAITDNGLSLSYVLPTSLTGGQYIEAIAEIVSGEGDEDQPTINNDAFVDSPALNTHLLWNHDIARDWSLEIGGSWLTGKHNDDNQQNVNLFGGDVTLIHTDPTGGFFNQLLQLETIYGNVDTSRDDTQHAWGAYFLAQQQLNRDWYAGVRLDWTEDALDDTKEVWAVSPYITWYWSEFLRFRLEYQHKDGDKPSEDTLYFQATWVFGAHPPHPYWSMK
jgi:hypothetical protein